MALMGQHAPTGNRRAELAGPRRLPDHQVAAGIGDAGALPVAADIAWRPAPHPHPPSRARSPEDAAALSAIIGTAVAVAPDTADTNIMSEIPGTGWLTG